MVFEASMDGEVVRETEGVCLIDCLAPERLNLRQTSTSKRVPLLPHSSVPNQQFLQYHPLLSLPSRSTCVITRKHDLAKRAQSRFHLASTRLTASRLQPPAFRI
jgi:hypothetical protein